MSFAGIGLFAKAVGGGLWRFIKSIPWQVWAVLIALFIVWRVYDYHVDTVADAYSDGYKDGYKAATDDIRDQSERNRKAAEARRRSTEGASQNIVKETQDAREQELADLRKRLAAASERLRRQGEARGGSDAVGANLPGVPGPAGPQPAGGTVDGGLVAVPREPLLSFAEGHDRCLIDRRSWEAWYTRHKSLFDNWQTAPSATPSSTANQRPSSASTKPERSAPTR